MTSLTRAKQMTRLILLGLGVLVVFLIIGRGFLSLIGMLGGDGKQQVTTERPTVTFGQIDQPILPQARVNTESATIDLDLVAGNYPQASSTAVVYQSSDTSLSLSAQDRARARAKNLGFTTEPAQPTPSTFKWEEGIRSLIINLSNQTFNFSADISRITFGNRHSFSRFTPISEQTSRFIRAQFQYTDLQYEFPEVQFVSPVGERYIPQSDSAIAPTNYARATFLRQKINNLPIYSAAGKFGPISIVIVPETIKEDDKSTALELDQIVELENNYFPIQLDKSSTYPIITAQEAYEILKKNLGVYLVSVSPINNNAIPSTFSSGRVLFITLSYLEPDSQNSDYVQPVWMFEGRANTDVGDARWIAYVPAIDQAMVRSMLGAN